MSTSVAAAQLAALTRRASAPAAGSKTGPKAAAKRKRTTATAPAHTRAALETAVAAGAFSATPASSSYAANKQNFQRSSVPSRKASALLEKLSRSKK